MKSNHESEKTNSLSAPMLFWGHKFQIQETGKCNMQHKFNVLYQVDMEFTSFMREEFSVSPVKPQEPVILSIIKIIVEVYTIPFPNKKHF